MKITGIIIAVMLVLVGFAVVAEISPSTVSPLEMFNTPLHGQNWTWAWSGTAGLTTTIRITVNDSSIGSGYSYHNDPIVITSSEPNGLSTHFAQNLSIYRMDAYCDDGAYLYATYTISTMNENTGTWTTYLIGNTSIPWSSQDSKGTRQMYAIFGDNVGYLTGTYVGIIEVKITMQYESIGKSVVGIPDNVWSPKGTVFQQAYLVSGGGSLSVYPGTQQNGGKIYMTGHTGFGKFYIQIDGSQSYNGGMAVANYTISQDTTFNVSYTVPQNAFIPNGNNEWNVYLENSVVILNAETFFTVDQLNLIPPTPTVTITNQPTDNIWTTGSQVDILVTTANNKLSGDPVTSIEVWVYLNIGGMPAPGSGMWVIDGQTFAVTNNTVTFSYIIPTTIEDNTIQVRALDSVNRSSQPVTLTILATHIKPPHGTQFDLIMYYATIAGLIVATIAGIVAIVRFVPLNKFDRAMISVGFGAFMLIISYAVMYIYWGISIL